MKFRFFGLLSVFVIVGFLNSCSSNDSSTLEGNPAPLQKTVYSYTYTSFEEETLALVNSYRVSIGLNVLEKNNYISLKSEEHNNYMIANNIASHDNFDVRYQNITQTLG